MVHKAVAYYHELLSSDDLGERSRQQLDEQLEQAKLVFGGRRVSPYLRPHFVSEKDFAQVTAVCETVWSAIKKVEDAAVRDTKVLDELGLSEQEQELARINPGYTEISPTARLDSFLTNESYSFVELNGESPAGIAFADAACEIFMNLPVMRRFVESYDVRALYGSRPLLDALLRAYGEFLGRSPDHRPHIAIVDLRGLPTHNEFELFKEFFEREGYPASICAPDELEFSNGKLHANGVVIDIVYKRLLVNEYLPVMQAYPAFVDAYRAGAVCVVNSFRSKLIHKKALFAVLTDKQHAHLFTEEEQAAIRAHVPWTRRVRAEHTEHKGERVDLPVFIRSNRERLVLKPNDDYGGHGVYIGWNSSVSKWDEALSQTLESNSYVVQERVQTSRETFPAITLDGRVEFTEQLVDLDPLLFYGRVGSAFTRLSSTELANVSSGGGMVPTLLINKK